MQVFSAKQAPPRVEECNFPVEIRHNKSAGVVVYSTSNRATTAYTVSWYVSGKRQRQMRRDFKEAFTLGQKVALKLGDGSFDFVTLGGAQKFVYERAVKAASDAGVSLDTAVARFVEAAKIAGGPERVIEAARHYVSHTGGVTAIKTVSEVTDELISNRRSNGKSEIYLRDLRVRLQQRFCNCFQVPVTSITTTDVERFLMTVKGKPRTKKNFLTCIGTLLQFAKDRGYLPDSHPGISKVQFSSTEAREVEIFTVDEMQKLLMAAKSDILPMVAIGAFAGLRSEEIKRLDWSSINFREKFIEVTAKNAKTRTRRVVPLTPNLRLWLLPYRKNTGPVFPFANHAQQFAKLAADAGVPWKRNGLRHSFVSYRVASTGNISRTALEAGNSASIVRSSYLQGVSKGKARRWFNIKPMPTRNVIHLRNRRTLSSDCQLDASTKSIAH